MDLHTAYATIYFEINLISFVLIALVHYKTAGISKMVAQRNFSMAVGAEMVFIFADAVCVSMEHGMLPHGVTALFIWKSVYFFSSVLMCFFWFLYFEQVQGSPLVKNRMRVFASTVLIWLSAAVLLANASTGILFYVDAKGAYHRGSLFLLQYLLSYFYVFFSCGRALLGVFRKKNSALRNKLIALALLPVLPAIAGVMQFHYPELPLAGAVLALETMALYIGWTDEMISLDPLTHLNNRKQLSYSFEQWRRSTEGELPLYLMIIDADHFKAINDTYGHNEGDAALMRIAEVLRAVCREYPRRVNIARYGGDEFVLLVWAENMDKIEALRRRIGEALEEANRKAAAPYELRVSIGATRADGGKTLRDLIEEADRRLYEAKSARNAQA